MFDPNGDDAHANAAYTALVWDAEALIDDAVNGDRKLADETADRMIGLIEAVRASIGKPEETIFWNAVTFDLGESRTVRAVPHEPIRFTRKHGLYIGRVPHKDNPGESVIYGCETTAKGVADALSDNLRELWFQSTLPVDDDDHDIRQTLNDHFTMSFTDPYCFTTDVPGEKA